MRTKLWMVLSIAVLLGTVLWFPGFGHGKWVSVALNAGHGVVFTIVAVLCQLALRSFFGAGGAKLPVAAFGLAVLLGAAVELLQLPIGRDADVGDVVRDALGAWAGLAVLAALAARTARGRLTAAASFVVPAVFLVLPVVECGSAYLRRAQSFPVLADFAGADDRYFTETVEAVVAREELPLPWAAAPAERALRVTFARGPYSGVDFMEPVANWSQFRELAIDVTNTGAEPLSLSIRIHDGSHDHRYEDRFNRTFDLAPEQRATLAIPLEEIERGPLQRKLDLTDVADFMLFTTVSEPPPARAQAFFLSRVWLR